MSSLHFSLWLSIEIFSLFHGMDESCEWFFTFCRYSYIKLQENCQFAYLSNLNWRADTYDYYPFLFRRWQLKISTESHKNMRDKRY